MEWRSSAEGGLLDMDILNYSCDLAYMDYRRINNFDRPYKTSNSISRLQNQVLKKDYIRNTRQQ